MEDLSRRARPEIALSDGASVNVPVGDGNAFRLSTAASRTLEPSGAGYPGQVITIRWTNTDDEPITTELATGSANDFRYLGGATALRPTAAGATDYIAAAWNAQAERWDVIGYSGADWPTSSPTDFETAALSDDVSITSNNTYTSGPQITVGAGTWLITAHITMRRNTTTAIQWAARIFDGTNSHASGAMYIASNASNVCNISMAVPVTVGGSTTFTLQGLCSAGASGTTNVICAALPANGVGNNATRISAIRLA